jgi:hypothetical protein
MSVDDYIPEWAKEPSAPMDIDSPTQPSMWREALVAALIAGVVVGSAVLLANQAPPSTSPPDDNADDDELVTSTEELEAAARLGVDVDASDDVVRAALRERLVASRIHPDQGGDHDVAAQLIAAKNLLCARARRRERTDAEATT